MREQLKSTARPEQHRVLIKGFARRLGSRVPGTDG
jgi:hypothetical protein